MTTNAAGPSAAVAEADAAVAGASARVAPAAGAGFGADRDATRAALNPYVFVVGAARSGTTLLQRMLDAHPQLAVVNETYWVPRKYRERTGLTRRGLVTPALVPQLLARSKFARMEIDEQELVELLRREDPIRYEHFVSLLFDRYAARRGKLLAGDKTPGYVRRIPEINELWPRARFVHIVRDPRDVCLSMLEWSSGERTAGQFGTWAADPVVSTALYWRYSVAVGAETGSALGPGLYDEVRYEDLLAAPDRRLERICAFLHLPYAGEMLRYHEGRTRRKVGRSSKAQWLPPTTGLREWQAQMPADDVERIEAAAGDLLARLGYERRFERIEPRTRDLVANLHETFTEYLKAKGRRLPRGW